MASMGSVLLSITITAAVPKPDCTGVKQVGRAAAGLKLEIGDMLPSRVEAGVTGCPATTSCCSRCVRSTAKPHATPAQRGPLRSACFTCRSFRASKSISTSSH